MTPSTSAVVAIALFVVFGAIGFGWRSWLHHRRTGSTGFKGIIGRPLSIEWFAGVGFVAAIVVGVAAPSLQWAALVEPLPVPNWVPTAGIAIAFAGIAATVYAQIDMGDSWRIGVDHSESTTLVHRGVFAVVRNPIFTAMLVFAFGIMLVTPNIVAILGFTLLLAAIELQVRAVEEPYLRNVHGPAYREYLATVGRFVPRIGTTIR